MCTTTFAVHTKVSRRIWRCRSRRLQCGLSSRNASLLLAVVGTVEAQGETALGGGADGDGLVSARGLDRAGQAVTITARRDERFTTDVTETEDVTVGLVVVASIMEVGVSNSPSLQEQNAKSVNMVDSAKGALHSGTSRSAAAMMPWV